MTFPSAFLARDRPVQVMPYDTGCVFPHGVGGRNVRVRLMTDNPVKAQALGVRLQQWGLPLLPSPLIVLELNLPIATNPWGERKKVPEFGGEVAEPPIRFAGCMICLEMADASDPRTIRENVVRFARWMCERNAAEKKARADAEAKAPPTLEKLADAGEIETFDAG